MNVRLLPVRLTRSPFFLTPGDRPSGSSTTVRPWSSERLPTVGRLRHGLPSTERGPEAVVVLDDDPGQRPVPTHEDRAVHRPGRLSTCPSLSSPSTHGSRLTVGSTTPVVPQAGSRDEVSAASSVKTVCPERGPLDWCRFSSPTDPRDRTRTGGRRRTSPPTGHVSVHYKVPVPRDIFTPFVEVGMWLGSTDSPSLGPLCS